MKSSKTKKVKFINKKTMIASVDIGKNLHYGYFRAADGHELKAIFFLQYQEKFSSVLAQDLSV